MTIRRASRFLASHAKVMVDSTLPPRCNTVPRRASLPYERSSENSRNAYMPPHTRTGPPSSTRATRTGADTIDLACVRMVRSDDQWVLYRWSRIAKLLFNPGDTLLVEEWSYPSALATVRPLEVRLKAVPMDDQGMRPDSLRAILAGWNVERDGPRCVRV
jgi:hypothetical protein